MPNHPHIPPSQHDSRTNLVYDITEIPINATQ